MKQTFWWAFVLAFMAFLAAPASATTISFAPNPAAVQVGDTFAVNVFVADATDLYGFQFDVAFDPTLIQANAVLEGDFLSDAGGATFFVPGTIDNMAGTLSFTANTLLGTDPGATGDGFVVHLLFQALAEGQGDLLFGNVLLLDSALAEIDATSIPGFIKVSTPSQVPEPASAVLVAIGLAALTARGRQRMRNSPRLG